MTLFLASVRDKAEAGIALLAHADVIDLKEPANGALGALDRTTTTSIVSFVAGRVPVSATIGDSPMQPELICHAVMEKAICDVDYVKFGLFPGGDPQGCLSALRLAALRVPDFDAVGAAGAMGAAGIMLDTADKGAGSLLAHLDRSGIARFVVHAKSHGLMVGVAGSLTADDVPELLSVAPDLIGFRGALCRGSRSATLDPEACADIRALIPRRAAAVQAHAPVPNAVAEALC